MKDFYDRVKDNIGNAQRAFKQAIEETEANVKWMKKHYKTIEKWIQENRNL